MQKLEEILAEADKIEELLQGGIFEEDLADLIDYTDAVDLIESESYSNLR